MQSSISRKQASTAINKKNHEHLKLVVLGDHQVDIKSDLLNRFASSFIQDDIIEPHVDRGNIQLMDGNKQINLSLSIITDRSEYDQQKQEPFESTDLIVLVFSRSDNVSFENIFHRWLPEARYYTARQQHVCIMFICVENAYSWQNNMVTNDEIQAALKKHFLHVEDLFYYRRGDTQSVTKMFPRLVQRYNHVIKKNKSSTSTFWGLFKRSNQNTANSASKACDDRHLNDTKGNSADCEIQGELFLQACVSGDISQFEHKSSSKFDINYTRNNGDSGLHIAAAQGNRDMLISLRKLGANSLRTNLQRKTALDVAIESGHQNCIDILFEMEAKLVTKFGFYEVWCEKRTKFFTNKLDEQLVQRVKKIYFSAAQEGLKKLITPQVRLPIIGNAKQDIKHHVLSHFRYMVNVDMVCAMECLATAMGKTDIGEALDEFSARFDMGLMNITDLDGNTLLHHYAIRGDAQAFKKFSQNLFTYVKLDDGPDEHRRVPLIDLMKTNNDGKTALEIALVKGHQAIVNDNYDYFFEYALVSGDNNWLENYIQWLPRFEQYHQTHPEKVAQTNQYTLTKYRETIKHLIEKYDYQRYCSIVMSAKKIVAISASRETPILSPGFARKLLQLLQESIENSLQQLVAQFHLGGFATIIKGILSHDGQYADELVQKMNPFNAENVEIIPTLKVLWDKTSVDLINAPDENGKTRLVKAIEAGDTHQVVLLIKNGANCLLPIKGYENVIDFAKNLAGTGMIKCLLPWFFRANCAEIMKFKGHEVEQQKLINSPGWKAKLALEDLSRQCANALQNDDKCRTELFAIYIEFYQESIKKQLKEMPDGDQSTSKLTNLLVQHAHHLYKKFDCGFPVPTYLIITATLDVFEQTGFAYVGCNAARTYLESNPAYLEESVPDRMLVTACYYRYANSLLLGSVDLNKHGKFIAGGGNRITQLKSCATEGRQHHIQQLLHAYEYAAKCNDPQLRELRSRIELALADVDKSVKAKSGETIWMDESIKVAIAHFSRPNDPGLTLFLKQVARQLGQMQQQIDSAQQSLVEQQQIPVSMLHLSNVEEDKDFILSNDTNPRYRL